MTTLGEQIGFNDKWSPLSIDLDAVKKILEEVNSRHDVQDPTVADSLSKRILIIADHLSNDLTRTKLYYTTTRSKAKDRLNDVKQSAIEEKSDAGKERVALADPKFRELRDEYKKAELLMTHLEIKYKELISYHYSFKDTARRLSGLWQAGSSASDSEKKEEFATGDFPVTGTSSNQAKEEKEPF